MSDEEGVYLFPFIHPVKELENLVPHKFQKGLFTVNIHFTCLDVTTNYIVVGTNVGISYLFNRISGEMQKLQCQGSTHAITCVCCLEAIDLMVALGTSTGLIIVFKIPLHRSSSIDAANETERYLITNIHFHRIACLEWSMNGMKLFSGCESGLVAETDIDYMKRISKSVTLLEGNDSVIQLHYCQRMLLVSTVRRTLLYFSAEDLRVTQIGQKERKSLGSYGACFFTVAKIPQEVVVFAARPALRIWKANTDGKVLETFLFKENSLSSHKMLLVGYDNPPILPTKSDSQFGIVHCFSSNCLMTWNGGKLFVVSLKEPAVVFHCDVFGGITSASVCEDEIFVLNGERSVTRISSSSDHSRFIPVPVKEESLLQSLNFMPNALKELEFRLKGSSIFNKMKPKHQHKINMPLEFEQRELEETEEGSQVMDDVLAIKNESFPANSETRPVLDNQNAYMLVNKPQSSTINSPKIIQKALDNWNPLLNSSDSDSNNCDGIVFERKVRVKQARSLSELHFVRISDPVVNELHPDVGNGSVIPSEFPTSNSAKKSLCDAIVGHNSTRQEKEIILAQMFNLEELLPDELKQKFVNVVEAAAFDQPSANIGPTLVEVSGVHSEENRLTVEVSSFDEKQQHRAIDESQCSSSEFVFYRTNCMKDHEEGENTNHAVSECSSYLSYGPPSGSSNVASLGDNRIDHCLSSSLTLPAAVFKPRYPDDCKLLTLKCDEPQPDTSNSRYSDVWVQHRPPGHIRSLTVCEHYMVCTDFRDTVYYSHFGGLALEWHKADYLANQVAVSHSGKRVWKIYRNSVYVLVQPSTKGPFGTHWVQVELNVIQVAVTEICTWYVTVNGDAFVQCFRNEEQAYTHSILVACPTKVTQVACSDGIVWAITIEQSLICRLGITKLNPQGTKWGEVSFNHGNVLAVALGTSTGWVVNEEHHLWFKTELSLPENSRVVNKKWWQVKIADYVYSNTTVLQNLMDSLHAEQLTTMLSKQCLPCIVCTKMQDIWFYHPQMNQLLTNQNQIIGHQWNHIKLPQRCSLHWRNMTSSGIYHHHGVLWLWRQGLDLGCFSPMTLTLSNIKLPECCCESTSLCLSAAPETFWLLTGSGQIFIRKDITVLNALGTGWVELDLSQIDKHKLTHISCGSNLVWACDSKGSILMRIGSLQAPSICNFLPAWVVVEDSTPEAQPHFIKVYVGPLDYAVWAIDKKNNIYVREGIFPELLIGLGWVFVSGIQATQLAISECAVYALTTSGTIYRRYNISQSNYIGDYWMELPGQAEHISVTVDDKLWALSVKNELIQHQSHMLYSKGKVKESETKVAAVISRHQSVDEDWEMIDGCT